MSAEPQQVPQSERFPLLDYLPTFWHLSGLTDISSIALFSFGLVVAPSVLHLASVKVPMPPEATGGS